jgi:hypothetical protein
LLDTYGRMQITGGYCWSFYFHATRRLLLREILAILGLQ